MAFGQKVGTVGALKKQLKRSSTDFIRYVPKDGGITVRFLTEPEEWVSFREVWDNTRRTSYPLPEEGMPGYVDSDGEARVSTKYLTCALDTENDKVIAFQMGKDLVNQFTIRYEKYGTVMDRDYEIFRSGEGLDTTYGITPEAPTTRKLSKYTLLNLEDVLEEAYINIFGEDASTPKPKGKPGLNAAAINRKKTTKAVKPEPDEDGEDVFARLAALAADADESDDEQAVEAIYELVDEVFPDSEVDPDEYGSWAEYVEALAAENGGAGDESENDSDEDTEDEEDAEPEVDEEDEDEVEEDGDYYTEEELSAMSLGALRALARDNGIPTSGMNKQAIIGAILGGGDDADDEDEPF